MSRARAGAVESAPMKRLIALALLALGPLVAAQSSAPDATRYLVPPPQIVATFDAAPLPQVIVSPTRQTLAIVARRGSPPLAELARPTLRLAGERVDPKNNGPHRTQGIYAITLKRIADGGETRVVVPAQANLSNIRFSPDGARLAFTNTKDDGIDLWVADTATGQSKRVNGTDRLNAATGDPCDWLHDNVTLVCQIVPPGRGPAPAEPLVPAGPTVLESHGKAAPAPT